MAGGWWGNRFPIGNLLCTKLIFTALAWRLYTCRIKNAVKRLVKPGGECIVNDLSATKALNYWMKQGYHKLNIGGGNKNLEGFVNLDFVLFPEVQRQVVANILDLSFVPTCSMSHLHSNHMVEHLTSEQLKWQLSECWRILKPDGLLTLRCPNALGVSYGFWFGAVIERDRSDFVTVGFPADEDFGNPDDRWLDKDFYGLVHWLYGDAGNIRNQHLIIATPSKLRCLLQDSGFEILRMTEPEAINIVVVAKKR